MDTSTRGVGRIVQADARSLPTGYQRGSWSVPDAQAFSSHTQGNLPHRLWCLPNEFVHGWRWRANTLIVDHGRRGGNRARSAIIGSQQITGLTAEVIAELVAEIGPLWHERHQAVLTAQPHRRAVGAGAKHKLVFVDRLLATLVHLRHGATHDVLACWFGVGRSTITRAIGEVRPLLAGRGCTVTPGLRLRTLAEVIDHLGADGRTGIIDGTEVRVRRPAAGRQDREKFISRKNKQNAVKSTVVTDAAGGCCSAVRRSRPVARTSRTPGSWAWSSSCPTGPWWRS
ncbi:transposase family protein [Streptomyces sp. NPDC059524]|uniref:helix-turn-helix domain-containing protein n=1 Tax=Streptomyces sp. NPDC059524 TaxID=3346856 RepID=UPI0036C165D0